VPCLSVGGMVNSMVSVSVSPCVYKVRLTFGEWLIISIYLHFFASIILKALVQSGGQNPMFRSHIRPNNNS